MHALTDNVKTVYPPQTKFAGGIIILYNNACLCLCVTTYLINYKGQSHREGGAEHFNPL